MIFDQGECWRRTDAGEDLLEMIAEALPDHWQGQLLRSLGHPALRSKAETRISMACLSEMGMQAGQRDRRLPRMLGSSPHRGHQSRSAYDRLAPGIGQAHEQAPPIVGQRYPASGQLAAMQVVRGEAAKSISALLVFGVFF